MSTSRVEGAHSQLKRYLINRLSSLKTLHEAIEKRVAAQVTAYRERLHKQSKFEVARFREHPLTAKIHMNVTNEALTMLWPQLEAAEEAIRAGTYLPKCVNAFTKQWGLPCRHRLYDCLVSQRPLGYEHFSRHWWLWDPEESELSREEQETRLILDPFVVPKTRYAQAAQEAQEPASQWPRPGDAGQKRKRDSGHDNSTRRDPSHWESGRRQKKPAVKKKAPRPTIRGLTERLDAIQAFQQSQAASQVSSTPTLQENLTMQAVATPGAVFTASQPMLPPVSHSMVPPASQPMPPPASQPMLPPALQLMPPPASQPMLPPALQLMPPPASQPMLPSASQIFAPRIDSCMPPPSAQAQAYGSSSQRRVTSFATLMSIQNQVSQVPWDGTQRNHEA